MALNPRQRRFVAEYLIDCNATQAAIRAGYSAKTAKQIGSQLLTNLDVLAAVAAGQAEIAEKLDITHERVLRRLGEWAFGDPRKLFDAHGNLKPIHELPDEMAVAISEVEVTERAGGERLRKVKRVDPLGAMNTIAKVLGMVRDKVDVNVSGDLASRLDAAKRRDK